MTEAVDGDFEGVYAATSDALCCDLEIKGGDERIATSCGRFGGNAQ